MPIIEAKNLTFTYGVKTPFEKKAVDGVDFSIEKGDFIGLIGHTGSGKSTLVQMLNGLIRPTAGTVFLKGKNIWEFPKEIRKIRFEVGLVFQYPEYQLFEETVYKDIAFGPKNMGLTDEEVDKRVKEAAQFTGLKEEILEKSPFDLSGGQKRRVAIAGVMAMEPEILILDEPTAGLDPKGRDSILSRIRTYHAKKKSTVILVSHSMEDIARNARKIMVMDHAGLALFDTKDNIFERADELERMGLSIPQITKVFLNLQKRGYALSSAVYTVEQGKNEILRYLHTKKEGKEDSAC